MHVRILSKCPFCRYFAPPCSWDTCVLQLWQCWGFRTAWWDQPNLRANQIWACSHPMPKALSKQSLNSPWAYWTRWRRQRSETTPPMARLVSLVYSSTYYDVASTLMRRTNLIKCGVIQKQLIKYYTCVYAVRVGKIFGVICFSREPGLPTLTSQCLRRTRPTTSQPSFVTSQEECRWLTGEQVVRAVTRRSEMTHWCICTQYM